MSVLLVWAQVFWMHAPWTGTALAQSPGLAPPGLAASLVPTSANARWMVSDVTSKRFFGEDTPGPTFKAGEEVELIMTDGALARVHLGTRYGWVPADTLTNVQPLVAPPSLPSDNPLLGGLPSLAPAPAPQPAPVPAPAAPAPAPASPDSPNTP